MTTPHRHVGFAGLEYSNIEFIGRRILCLRTTSDGCNLAATIHAVADDAIPKGYVGYIDITIGCIAAAKGVACFVNDVVAWSILVNLFNVEITLAAQVRIVIQCLICNVTFSICLYLIVVLLSLGDSAFLLKAITHETIEDIEVGRAAHHTTFATGIGITCDGRYAVVEVVLFLVERCVSG